MAKGAYKTLKPHQRKKFLRVMKEWKAGKLRSSSGGKVTDQKQAIAIAFSEASNA